MAGEVTEKGFSLEDLNKYDPMVENVRKVVDQLDRNKLIDSMGLGEEVAAVAAIVDKIDDTMDSIQTVHQFSSVGGIVGYMTGKKTPGDEEETDGGVGRKKTGEDEESGEGGGIMGTISSLLNKGEGDEETEDADQGKTKKYNEDEGEGADRPTRPIKPAPEAETEEKPSGGGWFS